MFHATQTGRRIPTLDGWRAIAVMLVIGTHTIPMLHNSGTLLGQLAATQFSHAGYGVDIFFSISGYLICTLLLDEKKRTGEISLSSFYTRRFFRIVPPILCYLFVLLLVARFWPIPLTIDEVLSVVFFFRNYAEGNWYTGHFWSLAIEEHFYLAVPLLFLVFSWRTSLKIVIAAALLCCLIRWFEYVSFVTPTKIEFRTEGRLDGLMYGAALALLLRKPAIKEWFEKHLTLGWTAGIAIIAITLLIAFPVMPIRRTIVALVMPFMIAYTVLHPDERIPGILDFALIRWIGRLSYSLYIWQALFLPQSERPLPYVQNFPIAAFCILIAGILSYYLIEKPFIRFGHKVAEKYDYFSGRERLDSSKSIEI